ncbi:MFS transporter [Archangium minus]|uniref:MFS transporter n=1 Tax=Archangium minus TaxID=83450 RepID=UPI0037C150DD
MATFFEGYEVFALSQLLPQIRAEFGLEGWQGAVLLGIVNIGTVSSWAVVRAADLFGRRRVLGITIIGYTVTSLFTALAPSVELFALSQLMARIFLLGEWATALVIAAEEYPAQRRGFVIGIMQASTGLGLIACAATVPWLIKTPLGWRSVFLVGIVPLLLIAYARRDLRETTRFQKAVQETKPTKHIMAGPYRNRVLELALVWALTYACTQPAGVFWKEFALSERGWSDAGVSAVMTFSAVITLPLVFKFGTLLDRLGRRRGALLAYGCTILGALGAYTFEDPRALTLSFVLGVFGFNTVIPVLSAYTTERFPTGLRADAFAWSNNLLGRSAFILAPLMIAFGTRNWGWGWGTAVPMMAAGPLLALALIMRRLPETRGLELEETAALELKAGEPLPSSAAAEGSKDMPNAK